MAVRCTGPSVARSGDHPSSLRGSSTPSAGFFGSHELAVTREIFSNLCRFTWSPGTASTDAATAVSLNEPFCAGSGGGVIFSAAFFFVAGARAGAPFDGPKPQPPNAASATGCITKRSPVIGPASFGSSARISKAPMSPGFFRLTRPSGVMSKPTARFGVEILTALSGSTRRSLPRSRQRACSRLSHTASTASSRRASFASSAAISLRRTASSPVFKTVRAFTLGPGFTPALPSSPLSGSVLKNAKV